MNYIISLFHHYGYIVLFFALLIELIGFPTPGETLLTYCGFLAFEGKMDPVTSIIAATLGVIAGVTISYFIAYTLGSDVFLKYGRYIGVPPNKFEKASLWFNNYGNMLLLVALFIPGVRHVTGYMSGITKISYKKFALHAYAGAIIWVATFISIGRVLGSQWDKLHQIAGRYFIIIGIIVAVILVIAYLYKNYKIHIQQFMFDYTKKLFSIFHAVKRVRIFALTAVIIFISFVIILIALIGHLFGSDFKEFNSIAFLMVKGLIPDSWKGIMEFLGIFVHPYSLIFITLIMALWIIFKEKNSFNKLRFLIIVVGGGQILQITSKAVFSHLGFLGTALSGGGRYEMPSEQALMATVMYGFAVYLIKHHLKKQSSVNTITFICLIICFVSGLVPLYFKSQRIVDIIIGYSLGGIWLSINIILLETSNMLPKSRH